MLNCVVRRLASAGTAGAAVYQSAAIPHGKWFAQCAFSDTGIHTGSHPKPAAHRLTNAAAARGAARRRADRRRYRATSLGGLGIRPNDRYGRGSRAR